MTDRWFLWAAVALAAMALLAAPASGSAAASTDPDVIDVASLPAGPAPTAASLAQGVLWWHGRSVPTDFPADAEDVEILGAVDGRVLVTAFERGGSDFWSIDATGHARRIGTSYEFYDYAPRLVVSTGHLWVHYDDRTTPRTIYEIDARTGALLDAYRHNSVPHGLAPADQRLVDAWVARRDAVPDTEASTRDGALGATTVSTNLPNGGLGDTVVVRDRSDQRVLGSFTFPVPLYGGVDRVAFAGHGHVLVLTTVSFTRRHGPQQAIVRCSLSDGTCERATDVAGNMALGVARPWFEPAR